MYVYIYIYTVYILYIYIYTVYILYIYTIYIEILVLNLNHPHNFGSDGSLLDRGFHPGQLFGFCTQGQTAAMWVCRKLRGCQTGGYSPAIVGILPKWGCNQTY